MSNDIWSILCVTGFWGWVLAAVGFIIKAFPSVGVFRGQMALRWGCSVICFYSLWVVSMVHA